MLDVADAVEDGVAHVEVAAGKVDLRAQGVFALRELAVLHALKQIEVFLDRAVAPRADGGTGGVAAVLAELVGRELADIGQTLLDQLDRELVGLLKIVRAVVEAVAPVEAQPVDVLLDRVDELGILLGGVGVVHAEVAQAAEMLGRAEVDRQRLAVADVQIAVRLGREAGVHRHALKLTAGGDVLLYKSVNEISGVVFHLFLHSAAQKAAFHAIRLLYYNDYRIAKSIDYSIDFAAKRQVWQRMIFKIIRPMPIAMNIWQNSCAVLLRRKAARRKALCFSPSYSHYK